jgi:HSP20 family protein
MSIVRFDPFRDLSILQERVNRLLGEVSLRHDAAIVSSWVPAVDIFENGKELVLKAELPEVKREDVSVTVENHTLTLSGERRMEAEVKQEQYHRLERAYGTFSRAFSLPTTVDTAKISAEFKDGVLTVRLPFHEEARPRTITVDVAA